MIRPCLVLFASIAFAVAAWPGHVAGQDPRSTYVVVTVPADAKRYFDGVPTYQTGTTRTFYTPPLNPGKDYAYELKAELECDGRMFTQTKRILVRAGETTCVDFSTLGTHVAAHAQGDNQLAPADSWPRKVTIDGYTVTVYQPQIEM
jgi:uncharacterized protein (TIGR03000 family)